MVASGKANSSLESQAVEFELNLESQAIESVSSPESQDIESVLRSETQVWVKSRVPCGRTKLNLQIYKKGSTLFLIA